MPPERGISIRFIDITVKTWAGNLDYSQFYGFISETWDGSQWLPNKKRIFTYSNTEKTEIEQSIDPGNGTWTNSNRLTYTYDSK